MEHFFPSRLKGPAEEDSVTAQF